MSAWWREITGLVLPVACGGCGRPRTELCETCAAVLEAAPRRVRPTPEPAGLPLVYAVAPYGSAVRAVLLAHKERGALGLAGPLGGALAAAVRAGAGCTGGTGPLLLVPVPSARRATAARGHDPTRRIALAAAAVLRRSGTPARVLAVLRQRRAVADQAGLGARERQANLAGALDVAVGGRDLLGGGRVWLVDDLLTTGASLTEAARAVRAAGGAQQAGNASGQGAVRSPASLRAAVVAASPSAFEINRN
ncbi:ComF family protein [Streptomyces sp. B1I3]|uniref:ComF family protein n=1 Tax=Streptomyces sp. B1I3 TaxID=3042264 RepID=UPI0027830C6A|nr:ComF family protein [Streptomyces sp. B1I3]MDQ0796041.1 putative amidophosphoribosyltransferase [Streptomyces sp. B1I3]